MNTLNLIFAGLFGLSLVASAGEVALTSPDGKLTWTLSSDGEGIYQSLEKSGKPVLQKDRIGLVVNGKNIVGDVEKSRLIGEKSQEFPVTGKHKTGKVTYNEYVVVDKGGKGVIEARVFDDGLAFRYMLGTKERPVTTCRVDDELTSFRFPADSIVWTQDHPKSALGSCEGSWSPSKPDAFKKNERNPRSYVRTSPVTVELPGGGYAFIQEAGNFDMDWAGIKFDMSEGRSKTFYFQNPDGFPISNRATRSPWRVVLVSGDLGTLVNSDVINSLAPEPDKTLFPNNGTADWVKPGRAAWSWCDKTSTKKEDQKPYIDMAADFGFEYSVVDDGWKRWTTSGEEYPGMAVIKDLVEYGKGKNVDIWVWIGWYDIGDPSENWKQMDEFCRLMSSIDVKGLKVDYMDSASQKALAFYDTLRRVAAKHKLMINFHGANTPVGESRTWPNEVTREGILGGECFNWWALSPEHLCALPFTRMVSGNADFTGGRFGHTEKLRGTSWACQLAANVIFTSPMLHWVGSPEDMAEAFPEGSPQKALIKAIPSVWDETIVLPGAKIGEYAPFAKRSGDEWFIAVLNGKEEKTATISLDFLPQGKFKATVIGDLADKNDGWAVKQAVVTKDNKLKLALRAATGGAVVRLVPQK